MPNIKVKRVAIMIVSVALLFVAFIGVRYLLSNQSFYTGSSSQKKPLEEYVEYREFKAKEASEEHSSLNSLILKVVSTGKIKDFPVIDDNGKRLADAKLLKVYLDDGSARANRLNSFNIVIELVLVGSDKNIATAAIEDALYKTEKQKALEEFESGVKETSEAYIASLEEIQTQNLKILFKKGKRFEITPYTYDSKELLNYYRGLSSDSVNADTLQRLGNYIDFVGDYYKGQDSGFPEKEEEFKLNNLEDIIFVL